MKKILLCTLIPLGILILLAIAIPHFISLEGLKPTVQTKFKEGTGLNINLKGGVKFGLLPYPKITVEDIEILDDRSSKDTGANSTPSLLMEAKALSAQINFWELFRGKVSVHKIQALSPKVFINRLKSISLKPSTSSDSSSKAYQEKGSSKPQEFSIQIQEVEISDGEVIFSEKSGDSLAHISIRLLPIMESNALKSLKYSGSASYKHDNISLKGNLFQRGEDFGVSSDFTLMGHTGHFEGIILPSPFSLSGSVKSKGPVPLPLDSLTHQTECVFSANVVATSDNLSINQMELKSGPFSLTGNGSYMFKSGDAGIKLIGLDSRYKETRFHLDLSTLSSSQVRENPSFDISLSGNNAGVYLAKSKELSKLFRKSFLLKGLLREVSEGVEAKNLSLQIDDLRMEGSFYYNASKTDPTLRYTLSIPTLRSLETLLDIGALAPVFGNSIHIKGQTSLTFPNFKTSTVFSSPLLSLKLEGLFSIDPLKLDGSIHVLSQENHSILSKYFGKESINKVDLKASLDRIDLVLTSSKKDIAGKIFAVFKKQKTKIGGNISLEMLDLSHLNKTSNSGKSSRKDHRSHSEHPLEDKTTRTSLDISFLKTLDMDVTLKVKKILWDSIHIKDFVTSLQTQNNSLVLGPFQGSLFGGSLDGKATMLQEKSVPMLEVAATLTGAHVRHLQLKSNGFSLEQGALHASTHLTAHGPSYLRTLKGVFALQVDKGIVRGFDLKKAVHSLKAADTLGGILGLLDASFSNGQSDFKTLLVKLIFDKGIGRLQDTKLLSNNATILAQGTLELAPARCHITGDIQLHVPNIPSIGFSISGPVENPKTSLDTNRVESYITSQILPALLGGLGKDGKKVADVLTSLVPNGSSEKNKKGSQTNEQTNPLTHLVQNGLDILGI